MLVKTSTFFGADVDVSSGKIGHLSDFLASPDLRTLRYLLVTVEADLAKMAISVPISAAAEPELSQHRLTLGLSSIEIGHLVGIDLLREPSREKEQAIHDLIHWLPYWRDASDDCGPDLHSLKHMLGMQIVCSDGPAGMLDDLITDTADWSVPMLELNCARHLERELCLVPTASIESLDWSQQIVRLTAAREQVMAAPAHTGHSASQIEAVLNYYSTQK